LREFLRDLQVQKPKKPAKNADEEDKSPSKAFVPIAERKQHLSREVAPGDRPAPVTLSDLGSNVGAKERKNAYNQTIQSASDVSLSKERVSEVQGVAGVADRKAQWVAKTEDAPLSPRAQVAMDSTSPRARDRLMSYEKTVQNSGTGARKDDLVAERLAEAQGATGVKDRLGAWSDVGNQSNESKEQVAARLAEIQGVTGVKDRQAAYTSNTGSSSIDKGSLVQERLAEAKGVTGVKDRLGNWGEVSDAAKVDPNAVAERLAEVKGVTGVKDRMGQWNQVAAGGAQTSDPSKVEERLGNLGATGVKDRAGGWANKPETIISSTADPSLAEARTLELKKAASVKDRLAGYTQVAKDDKVVERAPVYIPQDASELPTKETQGQ